MVQDLRATLASVSRGDASLDRHVKYFKHTKTEIDRLLTSLPDSERLCHLSSSWAQIKDCPLLACDDAKNVTAHEHTELLNILELKCRQFVYWCSYWTIPDRLQTILNDTRPGYTIPFHALFEDDIPDIVDRQKILNYLAWSPNKLKNGLVDPESGLVYRYEEKGYKRVLSLLWLLLALVISTGIVAGGGLLLPLIDTKQAPQSDVLLGWAAVLTGTLVHVGIVTTQHLRTRGVNAGALPVSILPIIVNARLGQLMLKIGMALVAYTALAYATTHALHNDFNTFLLNAFLIGYSLNSVLDLLGMGMDQRASAQQANLQKIFLLKG